MSLYGYIHILGLFTCDKTIKREQGAGRGQRGAQIDVKLGHVLILKLADELLCLITYLHVTFIF